VALPEGLALLGDTVCSFNPVYGQVGGVSGAHAWKCVLLCSKQLFICCIHVRKGQERRWRLLQDSSRLACNLGRQARQQGAASQAMCVAIDQQSP
jgi:hypothetical protein